MASISYDQIFLFLGHHYHFHFQILPPVPKKKAAGSPAARIETDYLIKLKRPRICSQPAAEIFLSAINFGQQAHYAHIQYCHKQQDLCVDIFVRMTFIVRLLS